MNFSERQAMLAQMRRWKEDPVLFVRKVFGVEPTDQQVGILRDLAAPGAKVAVKAGHGVGKSAVASWAAIWHTFLFPQSKAAATAPSATQLRDVLMAEVAKWLAQAHPWVRDQLKCSGMRLYLRESEQTQFLTARTARPDKPDALQGLHATNMLFLIDECFGVADTVYEVAKGALSTKNSRCLMIGNPTATSGYAYNCFHKNKHIWKTHTLSCLGSKSDGGGLVDETYIDDMKTEYGEDSDVYKVRVLGEFPMRSINQLITRELAELAMKRQMKKDAYSFAPIILGVDVAWEGDDRSAVYLRQGLHSRKLGAWRNIDNMTLGGLVDQYWTETGADAVFIDVGWGTGVIDYLRALGRNPIAVNFGSTSLNPAYVNMRTMMWMELQKWLFSGGQIDADEALIEDLIGPQYFFQPNGKKMLERKKDMKKRGLMSPDLADALALTFAAPVQKLTEYQKVENRFNGNANKVQTEYDLFSH